jgi:hypothetical protein
MTQTVFGPPINSGRTLEEKSYTSAGDLDRTVTYTLPECLYGGFRHFLADVLKSLDILSCVQYSIFTWFVKP